MTLASDLFPSPRAFLIPFYLSLRVTSYARLRVFLFSFYLSFRVTSYAFPACLSYSFFIFLFGCPLSSSLFSWYLSLFPFFLLLLTIWVLYSPPSSFYVSLSVFIFFLKISSCFFSRLYPYGSSFLFFFISPLSYYSSSLFIF